MMVSLFHFFFEHPLCSLDSPRKIYKKVMVFPPVNPDLSTCMVRSGIVCLAGSC